MIKIKTTKGSRLLMASLYDLKFYIGTSEAGVIFIENSFEHVTFVLKINLCRKICYSEDVFKINWNVNQMKIKANKKKNWQGNSGKKNYCTERGYTLNWILTEFQNSD